MWRAGHSVFCLGLTLTPLLCAQEDVTLFETRVRPVLATQCYPCHGPDQQLSGLRVDSREALLKGGTRGPSLVTGDPESSLLIKAVRHDGLKMPVGGKLKPQEVAALEEWVRKGAAWPDTQISKHPAAPDRYAKLVSTHWAFQKVMPVTVPSTEGQNWSQQPVDLFIYERLKNKGLHPAKAADRRTLIRRLSYVLTGLPPTAEAVDQFVADTSPHAYEQLVDRTLASTHFGEQWARHWLDLVRYGETRGYEWNYEIVGAWRYRDYLIRALNADVPYDQLVREHIAGDLLTKPRVNPAEHINESVIGTAFYRLGEAGHDDCAMFREIALDVVDNQIDTLTKTFQGLTVACARCHNHKLDPIPTEDYYGLYSILNSSRAVTHTIDLPDANAEALARLRAIKGEIRQELGSIWKREAKAVGTVILRDLNPKNTGGAWRAALAKSNQKLENPGYPLAALLCETGSDDRWLGDSAARLTGRYRTEQSDRAAFNRDNFQAFGDFQAGESKGWKFSGAGLASKPVSAGDFSVAVSGDAAVSSVYSRGVYTNALSPRLNGALRSPYLPKDKKYLSLRMMGGSLAARRTVLDNCAIGENYKVLENDLPEWVRVDTQSKEAKLPVFVEVVTKSDNPRLPDRPEVLKPYQKKLLDSPYSYFGVLGAVLHDTPETPKEDLSHMQPLFEGKLIKNWQDLAARYEKVIEQAVERWAAGRATDEDARWLDWLTHNSLLSNQASASAKLKQLVDDYRSVESKLPEPRVVEGLADYGEGRDYPVLIGGNPKNPGKTAPRRYLERVLGETPLATKGSGRRELAEMIASADNPLTSRVMANRIWSYVFGRGLVSSVDNFGVLGEKPSHPQLLDYLATTFVDQNWSIKSMVRLLVTSETFKQSGEVAPEAREGDPENRLLHHYPLRRLEAESIRDSILLSSGKLRNSVFGPSTQPHRDQEKDYRRLFSGPLDGDGRRSLYLKVTRMEGTRFLDIFDYPNPMATRGARDVTNVPAQALTLMNDPFVITEAEECAKRVVAQNATTMDERTEELFRLVLGRHPTEPEKKRFRGLGAELASLHGVARDKAVNSLEVWKDLAHAAYNLKEFIYIQ